MKLTIVQKFISLRGWPIKYKVVEIESRAANSSQQKKGNDDYDSILCNNNENTVVDNGNRFREGLYIFVSRRPY